MLRQASKIIADKTNCSDDKWPVEDITYLQLPFMYINLMILSTALYVYIYMPVVMFV